jgi:hypothetical protein
VSFIDESVRERYVERYTTLSFAFRILAHIVGPMSTTGPRQRPRTSLESRKTIDVITSMFGKCGNI